MTENESIARRCFVIGPIGNKFAPAGSPGRESYEDALEVFEKVIEPACQMHSLEPIRADHIAVTGEITEQVFRHLYEDEVVIADLSNANPNVMYELGLRHTRPLLTIQIGEYGQLPFDITAVRTIQFSRSERGLIDARKNLERALAAGLTEGLDPLTATRIWLGAGSEQDSPSASGEDSSDSPADESVSTDDDLDQDGLLEQLGNIEDKFPLLSESADNIGVILERLGAVAQDSTREAELSNSAGTSAKARLAVVVRMAQALQEPANELTLETSKFKAEMEAIDSNLRAILHFVESQSPSDRGADIERFLMGIGDLARGAREGMQGLSQLGASVTGIEGYSKSLRRPLRQINASVQTMAKAAALIDEWDATASRLLQRASRQ